MSVRRVFWIFVILLSCSYVNPVCAYVATFDDGGIEGLYQDVDGSGVDVTFTSINDGFIYLSSNDLLSDTFDYAYAGDYDYDYVEGIVGSGLWMMDDHLPGDVQGSIIEFSDDVYFEQIWFAQAGDEYPVQGDSAVVTAYAADVDASDWGYQVSLNFDSPDDFNQWFSISPAEAFENVPIRKLVLTFNNINYGVWDHLVFDADDITDPNDPVVISATIDIEPDTLSLKSKGKWITCYIWLPEDCDVAEIDLGTILLEDEIEVELDQSWADEAEQVAICKFPRSEVQAIVQPGLVELTVSGKFTDGTLFEDSDAIRIVPIASGQRGLKVP